MDGNPTFTMLVSSTIIRSPRHSTYNASQRACLWFMVSPASGGLSSSARTDLTGYDNSSQRISWHPSVARCRIRGRPFVERVNPGLTSGPGTDKDGGGSRHPEEEAMPRYMLSVLIDPAADFASLPKEEQEQSGADVDAVTDALAESG